jgi:hypothetical protein
LQESKLEKPSLGESPEKKQRGKKKGQTKHEEKKKEK